MSQNFDFLFYPKKPKNYVTGPVKLYLRLTIDGRRSETTTALSILPDKWSAGKMKGNKEEAKSFNAYIDTLTSKLYDCHKTLLQNGATITAESLKNVFSGKGERQRMLIEIFKEHNLNIEKLIDIDYALPTLTKYNTTLSHLESFLKWKYKISDICLDDLKYEFLTDFEFYLKTQKKVAHNTTAKYLKNTKKVVNDCIAKGWLKSDPFGNYKITPRIVDRVFLTEDELELIKNKQFSIARISQVRDIFVFCCYTGFSFIDVAKLTPLKVGIGIDRERWVFTNRHKNNIPSNIPLLTPALEIIAKYKDHPAAVNKGTLLPVLTNQKMNAYLKEIADLCGFNKNLTFHVARHTFATTVTLTNDVPIETVSKMLGHKKIQTTQHYAKILDKKVSNDMQILRAKFEKKEQQPAIKKAN